MWIQNISMADVISGDHWDAGPTGMLIQIVDPDTNFPAVRRSFGEIHQFKFLDLERDDTTINDNWKISDEQATELVRLLEHALYNRINVVVHCHAGVCRSGAVCEIGVMLGFDDLEVFRSPNLLVKHKMMKVLNMTYDSNEPYTMNGVPFEYDELNNKKIIVLKLNNEDYDD